MQQQIRQAFTQLIDDLPGEVLSCYIPRPSLSQFGEKWRILKKNIEGKLEPLSERFPRTIEAVEALTLNAFAGQGIAFFDNGEILRSAPLIARPRLFKVIERGPFLLPLMADGDQRGRVLIVEIRSDNARIFARQDQELVEVTAQFDLPAFEEFLRRREIQDDIFFHANSRGASGTPQYHALGTDREAEAEKTEEAFYRAVWQALESAFSSQLSLLHIVGPEGTLGEFAKYAPSMVERLERHITGQPVEEMEAGRFTAPDGERQERRVQALTLGEAMAAAEEGRLAAFDSGEIGGLLNIADQGRSDEHMTMRDLSEENDLIALNALAISALRNGGAFDREMHERFDGEFPETGVLVEQRW
jgi:hypothetical protein